MAARRKTLEATRREGVDSRPLKARTILVADDDRGIVTQVRAGLGDSGYGFVECQDGTEVLSAIRAHQPDLLLMDVEMPGLGGVEVCRIVKANRARAGSGSFR